MNSDGTQRSDMPSIAQLKAAAPAGATFFSAMVDASTNAFPDCAQPCNGIPVNGTTVIDLWTQQPGSGSGRIVIERIDFSLLDGQFNTFMFRGNSANPLPAGPLKAGAVNGRYRIPGAGAGAILMGSFDNGIFSGGLEFPYGTTPGSTTQVCVLNLLENTLGAGNYAVVYGYSY